MKTKCIRVAALFCGRMVLTGGVRGKNEEKKAAATLPPRSKNCGKLELSGRAIGSDSGRRSGRIFSMSRSTQ